MWMTRPSTFWIAVAAITLVALYLLHQILLPFVVGAVGAYLLVPIVNRMEAWGFNRSFATLSIVFLFAFTLVAGLFVIFPLIVGEIRHFIDQFPKYIIKIQSIITDASGPWLRNIFGQELNFEKSSADLVSHIDSSWLDKTLRSMLSGGLAVLSLFSLIVVAPVVSIYMIIDWNRMTSTIESWLPPAYRADVHGLAREIDDTISGFVRGQLLICFILATFYVISLTALGLHHALILGLAAGFISFVPYIGAATGLVLSTCVALVQFWPNWSLVALVGSIFVVGETIADYVLSPRIIGRRVKLNPVWLIFALSAFGWLFGLVGMLVAVPVAAALGVVLRFGFARSQKVAD
jgi:predicted PurR-regulated permease PerM